MPKPLSRNANAALGLALPQPEPDLQVYECPTLEPAHRGVGGGCFHAPPEESAPVTPSSLLLKAQPQWSTATPNL